MDLNKIIKIGFLSIVNVILINFVQSVYLFIDVNFLSISPIFVYICWITLAFINVSIIYKKQRENLLQLSILNVLLSIAIGYTLNFFDLAGGIYILEGSSNSIIKNLGLSLIAYNTWDILIVMILSLFVSIILDFRNKSTLKVN